MASSGGTLASPAGGGRLGGGIDPQLWRWLLEKKLSAVDVSDIVDVFRMFRSVFGTLLGPGRFRSFWIFFGPLWGWQWAGTSYNCNTGTWSQNLLHSYFVSSLVPARDNIQTARTNFKRPKSPEDSFDLDKNLTDSIVARNAFI